VDGPLVSVIIPSYDRAVFLARRSLRSLLRQTYDHWEAIVVGDGPADGSLRAAVEAFADPRLQYAEIARPDYSGLSEQERWHAAGAAARNHGLQLARGDIIAPLDDDDEFLPNHLRDCVAALGAGTRDFVYGYAMIRDVETGADRAEDWYPWDDPATRRLFLERNIVFHSTVAYTSRYTCLRYPTDGRLPADYGLWLAIHAAGARFASLNTPQAVYYGESRSSRLRLSVPSLPPASTLITHLTSIVQSRTLSNTGPICTELEERIGARLGVPRVLATPNGDSGLVLALQMLRLTLADRRSDLVLPSYAHPSLINAALWNGFTPVFCDVDLGTLCVSPESVAANLTRDTAIVAAHHAHGNPCDMPALESLARSRGVALLADAAAAFGAVVGGRPVGSWGDVEVFSLSGTKALTAGEGGLVCSRHEEMLRLGRRLARYGIGEDSAVETPGLNAKLAELPAAVALASLPYVDGWLARRRRAEAGYRERLVGVSGLRFQQPATADAVSACKDAVLILESAAAARHLRDRLAVYRIESRPYYRPLHRMPAYADFRRGDLSATERLADCTVCVPLYNEIREEVVDLVAWVVREALG
jgi:dTDP-4-amino-4,6-dideoxygalactose transaminase